MKIFSTGWLTRIKSLLGLVEYDSKLFETAAGYQKLPSGLILQFEEHHQRLRLERYPIVTFPIAFPNACLNVTAIPVSPTQTGTDAGVTVSVITTTTFTATLGHAGGTWRPMWFAIGY